MNPADGLFELAAQLAAAGIGCCAAAIAWCWVMDVWDAACNRVTPGTLERFHRRRR